MRRCGSWAATIALVSGSWALLALRPDPGQLSRRLRDPQSWVAQDGIDAALTTLTGTVIWLVSSWFLMVVLCGLACRLPGRGGRYATAAWRSLVPAVMRRVVAGALGLGIATTTSSPGSTAIADAAPVSSSPATVHSTGLGRLPAPGWPHDGTLLRRSSESRIPPPRWPADGATHDPTQRSVAQRTGRDVTVAGGDSLWQIAASRLAADAPPRSVAAAWPRWYAANRAAIGDDPDLIIPGQVLHAPAAPGSSIRGEAR